MTRALWQSFGLISLATVSALLIGLLYSKGSADSAAQDQQPIPFNHAFHAGELALDCRYCHRAAHVSPTAGIPSLRLCMGCHQNMDTTQAGSMQTLLDHWTRKEPIAWVRLQRLPDFVYFTHERHLAHGLQCKTCHGEVTRMSSTPRAATFEMGWCLSCHQQRGASRDCLTCHK
ncbi:MAG: Molybdopterin oxidoreductase subunit, predicted, chaperone protein HtpG [Nitrospira sp.]|nr:cytochrome c3 family protein [Nitrospira sp.]ULA58706.1 MAG: Molybdopterin oxidoreductase subunit, predicted, chaperone protein HtpG [Nitrospira sp.]